MRHADLFMRSRGLELRATSAIGGRCAEAGEAFEECDQVPIALGFGISTAEQFAEVGEFADAVVVGSAIVETVERNRGRESEAVKSLLRGCT